MSFAFRAAVFSVSLIILYSTTAQARFGTPWRPSKETVAEPVAEEAAAPIPSPDPDLAFESTHFSGSGNCSSCHDGLRDNRGVDLSIGRAWSATMMAHATRDPVFQAKFASEVKRHPALGPVLSAKCLRCHAPMASVDADYDGSQLTLLDGQGVLDPANPYHDQAMEGVSCTACHQIQDTDQLGEPASFSGGFSIPTIDEQWQRVAYGQYDAPFAGPMRRNTGFVPQHSAHMDDSAMCATCHNLNTPVVDADGVVISETSGHKFPEQAVYSELQHSDFADDGSDPRSCQDCHMASADGVRMSTRPRRLSPVDNFKQHGFSGANTVVLDMLDKNRSELGVTSDGLTQAVESARAFLRQAAELRVASVQRSTAGLDIELEVINRSGHKLPSGYPSRRVWIDLQVLDGQGRQLFHSGAMHADGSIEGVDVNAREPGPQPHHELIMHEDQVQVYEAVMGNTGGQLTHTLLAANAYLKDNRLTPRGFDKDVAPDDIAVVGEAMADSDFGDGSDRVSYRVPLSNSGPLTLKAALRYQPLSAGYLRDLFRDAELPLVARLQRLWGKAEVRAETLAEAEVQVTR